MIKKSINKPLNILTAFSAAAALMAITSLVLAIVYKYRGFGWENTPISCSTNAYFIEKYNHNGYLTTSNLGAGFSSVSCFIVACIAIYLRV